MGNKPLRDIRKSLTDKSNRLLLMYRRHCAPAVQAGQVRAMSPCVCLAETSSSCLRASSCFHFTPSACSSQNRSRVRRPGRLSRRSLTLGGNVASDVRAHYMRNFRSLSVVATMMLLYPRLLAIHDLADDVGFPASNGRLKTGRFMRASYNWMVSDGAYLMSASTVLLRDVRANTSQRRDRYDLVRLRCIAANH